MSVIADAPNTKIGDNKNNDSKKNDKYDELVDPNGAFQCEVPLNLPDGINNLAPELTLIYNSNVDNGIMGIGWYIQGIPEIRRDLTYDVSFTENDHFIYNGEKMLKTSDGYYHLRRENYERIEYNSSLGYWVVTDKSGTKYYFGYRATEHSDNTYGRIKVAGESEKILLWSLSKVVDIHGNYYIIEYNEDTTNGDYYPIRITYTQNEKKPLSSVRTVEFSYETRTDHCVVYTPTKMDMDRRLKWITVKMGSNLLRKWRLDYDYSSNTGNSRLTAIQEYGSDGNTPPSWIVDEGFVATGKTLPKQSFQWQTNNTPSQFNFKRWATNQGGMWDAQKWFVGDFNGDGKTDLMKLWKDNDNMCTDVHISKGNQFEIQRWATQQGGMWDSQKWFVGDFNGDGKTDLMKIWKDNGTMCADVHISKGSQFEIQRWATQQGGMWDTQQWFVGDINGDGKSDLMKIWKENGNMSTDVHLSNGSQFAIQRWATNQGGMWDAQQWFIGDFNGDGKSDLMKIWKENGNMSTDVHLSNGSQFAIQRWATNQGGMWDAQQWFVGDFNGDGKTDLMKIWKENDNMSTDVHLSNSAWDIISGISHGNNKIIDVEYTSIAQIPGAVIPEGKTYPNIAHSSPTPLVTKLISHDGLGHPITETYSYSNGMIHVGPPNERENLGFAWIEKQNEATGSLRTYYRQDDLDLRLLTDKEELRGTDGKLYTVKQYEYKKRSNSNQPEIKFIYTANSYTYNYNGESGTPVEYRSEFDYDDYGNLSFQKNYGDTSVTGDEQWTKIAYNNYMDNLNYLCLPVTAQTYGMKLIGQEGLASETRYYYDANYNLEHQELENGDQDVVIKYGYDGYGNVISKTDGNNTTATYIFDDTYQTFLTKETLKFTTETIYDELMRPIKTVDINGQVWETTYDVFSREKTTVSPGDTAAAPTTRITYPDEFVDASGNLIFPQRMKTEKKVADGDYNEVDVYIDGLNRIIQGKSEAQNGWTTVDHFFDAAGREYRISQPYFTTTMEYTTPDTNVKVKESRYDSIGRVAEVINSDGTSIKSLYGKLETRVVDESGHVIMTKESGNTQYTVHYAGIYPNQTEYSKTATIVGCDGIKNIDAVGKEFIATVDLLGRTIQSSTPLSGASSSSYDANGNLKTHTDAKNQTVTLEYDQLNRIIKKKYGNDTSVNYFYDEPEHGCAKGHLTRIEYPGGAESYTYDVRGRMTATTQTIGEQSRTKYLTYNSLDQLLTQIYPDGEVITHTYDQGGFVKTLKGRTTYVTDIDYYATGKVHKLLYGNGVQTDYDYYDTAEELDNSSGLRYSNRLRQIRTSKAEKDIFNLTYECDKSDNVKLKQDLANANYTESYDYDDFNRLIGANSASYGKRTYSYDMINNITSKDGRTYQYDSVNPYKLLNDGRYTYSYDANGSITNRSDGRVISWDYDNRVSAISTAATESYTYDSGYRRLKKLNGDLTTYYFFGDYEEEYQAGIKTKTVKYYFVNAQRVAEDSSTEGLKYYHQDHLGSSSAITDANGTLVLRKNNAPYGEEAATQGSAEVKYTFTGKEKDLSGFYYYGARYYDPEMGRFISVDPAGAGANWYAYCACNPVIYTDPTGMKKKESSSQSKTKNKSSSKSNNNRNSEKEKSSTKSSTKSTSKSSSSSTTKSSSKSNVASKLSAWGSSLGKCAFDLLGGSSYSQGEASFRNGDYLNGAAWMAVGLCEEVTTLATLGEGAAAKTAIKAGIDEVGVWVTKGMGKAFKPNMVDGVISESLAGAKSSAGNITSKYTVTADEALGIGDKLLGQGYKEIGKAGSGVFERQVENQTYRFRIDNNSLLGTHAPNTPHVHVEILDQNRNILANNHIPFVER